jgi:hypothetical protein
MNRLIVFSITMILNACNEGEGGNTADSTTPYRPADTNNVHAGSRVTDSTARGKLRPDGAPFLGDTSTTGNGQNIGIINDTSKNKHHK